MRSLLKALENGNILLSDGAWGTFLHSLGLGIGECPEIWNLTNPDKVLSIAKSYIDAGSDMILTNSFGGHPKRLNHFGYMEKAYEINKAAAEISKKAAGENHFVLGSMGPCGAILLMGEIAEEEIYAGFKLQAEALKAGGADAVCIETMSALDEACLAIKAAKETGLEVICTFTFDKTVQGYYRTMMGVSPEVMVETVKEAGADIIGANCGLGIEQMIEVVKAIREADSSTPVLVHANAGLPVIHEGETTFPETPEIMSSKLNELIAAGSNIIGGCCGTGPGHIKAFAAILKNK